MNKKLIIGGIIILAASVGVFFYIKSKKKSQPATKVYTPEERAKIKADSENAQKNYEKMQSEQAAWYAKQNAKK